MKGLHSIRVRYCECDPMNVAHHGAFPAWLEMGRTELLRSQGGNYRELEASGYLLAVVRLEIRYRAPARYDDVLELETVQEQIGHVKLEHSYTLRRGATVIATAQTTLACIDREGRPQQLPQSLRCL